MLRLITPHILLIVFCCLSGYAQAQAGTANTDYFNPKDNRNIKLLIADINRAHVNPAFVHFTQGNMRRVKRALEYILPRIVNHPQALSLAAAYAIYTKKYDWAILHYKRALRLYPQYALTHAQYGKYLTDIDRVEAGIAKLKQAVEIDPKLTVGYVWLARAFFKGGNQELARQASEEAKALGYRGKGIKADLDR